MVIWYIFSRFGMLCQEKSGNPVLQQQRIDEAAELKDFF
jgi:hypothetical protein